MCWVNTVIYHKNFDLNNFELLFSVDGDLIYYPSNKLLIMCMMHLRKYF